MEIGMVFLRVFFIFLRWLLTPIFWWKSRGKKILPPINEPLLELSATSLAKSIRTKKISSEEVVRAYIKRIKEVNPILNAVVEDRFSAAIQDAKNVDNYLAHDPPAKEELEAKKPLLGVPVTLKESCSLEGLSCSGASLVMKGRKAQADGEAVARLKAAGAIPLLVSNTPELCLSWECLNLVTGNTCNPYDTNRTSGGSSGGEGALMGAGASVLGLGSDIAGSIRIPALFNGVFGHKPSPGLVSLKGHFPSCSDENYQKYLVIGPLVRFAEDLKVMMKVLVGEELSAKIGLDEKVDLTDVTVYYMHTASDFLLMHGVQKEFIDGIQVSVKHLQEVCHCKVSNLKFVEMNESSEMGVALVCGMKDIPYILESSEDPKVKHNLYIETLKSMFGLSKFSLNLLTFYILQRGNGLIPRKHYEKYMAKCKALGKKFADQLGTSGVFLYPTFCCSAFRPGESILTSHGLAYVVIFNILGLPSTHVPLGLDKNGLPIGIQVVAAPNQDRLCLAVAMELERRFGGWKSP